MEGWLAALFGLIGGTVASLIAPWAHWGVEKQRIRLEARRQMIADVRQVLETSPRTLWAIASLSAHQAFPLR
jgi:hypothetical protein